MYIIKIDQSAFIRDLIINKKFINYDINIILIKARLTIEMLDPDNYNKTKLYKY